MLASPPPEIRLNSNHYLSLFFLLALRNAAFSELFGVDQT